VSEERCLFLFSKRPQNCDFCSQCSRALTFENLCHELVPEEYYPPALQLSLDMVHRIGLTQKVYVCVCVCVCVCVYIYIYIY